MVSASKTILKAYIILCNCCFNNYNVIILKRIIIFNYPVYIISIITATIVNLSK